ncbi:MAG TPA: hypothetical protein VMN36_19190 [Verrucomicrobiales bacterium]|nr:hypothetical protein [Verrucomicrobiales bacterium]
MSCVTAGGKLLGHEASAEVLAAFQELPLAQRQPSAGNLPRPDPSQAQVPSPPAGGIVLKVHGRFLARDGEGLLRHVAGDDFPQLRGKEQEIDYHLFLFEPNTEYMWLTEKEWKSLVPAEPVQGVKLAVNPAIALRMARFHLSPKRALTSEDCIVDQREVQIADVHIIVKEVTPARIRLKLTGFVHHGSNYDAAKATSPNGPLEFGCETPVHGILEFDRFAQRFVRFDIIAPGDVWGRWGDANGKSQIIERPGRTPIGFAFELATGDSPSNRLPPGGHGGRALRSGYFTEAQ